MCFYRLINADCSLTKKADFSQYRQNKHIPSVPSFTENAPRRQDKRFLFHHYPPFFLSVLRPSENHFTVIAGLAACKPWRTDGIMILPPWTRHGIGRLDENRAGVPATMYEIHCASPWSAAGAVCICCNYICNSVLAVFHKMYYLFLTGGIQMNDNMAYLTDTSKISIDKMNFIITNFRPKHSDKYKEIKSEIERKLFDVFKKYAIRHWKLWYSAL